MSRDSSDNKIITVADMYDDFAPRIKRLEIMVGVVVVGGIWDTMGRPSPSAPIEAFAAMISGLF
jgi:hypothetical protein